MASSARDLNIGSATFISSSPSTDTVSQTHALIIRRFDRNSDIPVGIIAIDVVAILVVVAALIRYVWRFVQRRNAGAIRIQQGWYTLQPQTRTSNEPATAEYLGSSTDGSGATLISAVAPGPVDSPGPDSTPAARRAYYAAELRAAQALLERGGGNVDVRKTKTRIRELETQLQSA
ncbi:hypothetical protein DFH09DRAFT_1162406 [Mycena vulgaris]|nr:hypothetical protein DFH09DRAFT_1162406 [Mycena vulgaris]